MTGNKALVLGASGLIGGHCLELLLADDYFEEVHVFVRRNLPINHTKLLQHIINFDSISELKPDFLPDHVFCCLGTTIKKAGSQEAFYKVDFTYAYELAKTCRQTEPSQFILVSAIGANPKSSIFYNRVKGELESAITVLNYKSFLIMRPSLLLGDRQEHRRAEEFGQQLFKKTSILFQGPLKKYKPIEAKTVAQAMVKLAKDEREGKHIFESHQISKIAPA